MPVKPPELPREPQPARLDEAAAYALEEGETISDALFEDDYLEERAGRMLDFSRCVFRRVQFCPGDIAHIHFSDCRFENCDLSGYQFRDGTLRRTALSGCRCTGTMFNHMGMRDVSFENCQLNYAGFVDGKLQAVSFERCQMAHALFHRCVQKELSLAACELEHAEIIETRMSGVDLSGCSLNGLRSAVQSLEGATVSLAQSPVILGLCGISVAP